MACGCKSVTKICLCQHKERYNERCVWYQLRAKRSCWSICISSCSPKKNNYRVDRVCVECMNYFKHTFGKEHWKEHADNFLSYKESKGWHNTTVEPNTIPLQVLADHARKDPATTRQPFKPQEPMSMSLPQPMPDYQREPQGNPRRPGDKSANGRSRTKVESKPVPRERKQGADRSRARSPSRHQERPRHRQELESRRKPEVSEKNTKHTDPVPQPRKTAPVNAKTKPLPKVPDQSIQSFGQSHLATDTSLFSVGSDVESDEENVSPTKSKSKSEEKRSPSRPKYTKSNLKGGAVVPELKRLASAHENVATLHKLSGTPELANPKPRLASDPAAGLEKKATSLRKMPDTPELLHPQPLVPDLRYAMTKGRRKHLDSPTSEVSLVSRLRQHAEQSFVEFNGHSVPVLQPVPKRKQRQSRLREKALANQVPQQYPAPSNIDIAFAARDDVPEALVPGGRRRKSSAVKSPGSPPMPPHRPDGVMIPPASACPHHHTNRNSRGCPDCNGTFYRERGVPSDRYIREVQSATLPPSVETVSVSTPRRSYSCAVQSCYCEDGGDKCLSCQERQSMSARFTMSTWI
ncbi:hypothetical protein GGS20DRAFT_581288 [Poronia punctata]|nr:hypothetical protein GGS20DRAFT_581288 [Poronia punctata]